MFIKRALFLVACAAITASALGAGSLTAAATTTVPNGQRALGNSIVEPVYDANDAGAIGFIQTPSNAPLRADPTAQEPLYLPVYPTGSTVGALICPHTPVDKCPDHGPIIAGLAQATVPAVYGAGVIGHDHVMQLHAGGDFHVALVPTVVLFTSTTAANEHLLTRAQIEAAIDRGDATAIPLPPAALHGEQVPFRVWALATPVV